MKSGEAGMDTVAQELAKIEKLYQCAMDDRDRTPDFDGSALLEAIYQRQYVRAYRITRDVAQFAWETRLYREIIRKRDGFARAFAGDARRRTDWIPVSERLPEQYACALIAHTETPSGEAVVEEAQWNGGQWILVRTGPHDDSIWLKEQVTHWQPLPAPPEVQP